MNQVEQLHDEIMDLNAKLEGKRLELAIAQGDAVGTHLFKESMYSAIRARVSYRMAIAQQAEQGGNA